MQNLKLTLDADPFQRHNQKIQSQQIRQLVFYAALDYFFINIVLTNKKQSLLYKNPKQ